MRKIITLCIVIILIPLLFLSSLSSVFGEQNEETECQNSNEYSPSPLNRSPRSYYTAYYNKTFSIDKSWEYENVSIIVFVQTMDQTQKNKESSGSSGTFGSAEVLQSTFNPLDGETIRTSCCRRVLFELITATWCGNCPAADGAFDRIERDSGYFPGRVTMVEIHPSSSGDFYNTDNLARHNWYNHGNSHPTAIFDGLYCRTGGNSNTNSTSVENIYKGLIDNRQAVPPVIDIITFGNKTGSSGWINVTIDLLSQTPLRNLKVQFMVVEDVYPYKTSHDAYLRHTLRDTLIPEDFTPPNHSPTIKKALPDVNIIEDEFDSTSIQLGPAFEDEDLDVLTFSSNREDSGKLNIEVVIDESGNVTLTPDADWNGIENITFYADDGRADPIEQSITVTVTNVNDGPKVAHPMVDFTMFEDIPIEDKFDLNYVFRDIDMDPDINIQPQASLDFLYSGNENIYVTIENGLLSFDPKTDWNGNDTITFTARDPSGLTVSDDVKIWVRSDNDPPVLKKALPKAILNEDESLEDYFDLNNYFIDNDGDALTYWVVEPDEVEIELDYRDKSVFVSIYPEENYWGNLNITFEAVDIPSSEPVIGILEVNIESVNDPPILNSIDKWNIISSGLSISDNTITIDEDSGVEFYVTAHDPADLDILTFSDDTNLFDIEPKSGRIFFTPTNNDVGEHEVEIRVYDGQAESNLDIESFKIIIENINDPPEEPQILSPTEGNTYIISSTILFKGTCDDPDLIIPDSTELLLYEWTIGQNSKTLGFGPELTSNLATGEYTIILTVTDNDGEKSSKEISITVAIDKNLDTDSDGVSDYLDDDDDNDGMPDVWENKYSKYLDHLNPSDAELDPDLDGYSNFEEYLGNDGNLGGNDSTDPTRKSSHPVSKKDDGGDGGDNAFNGAILVVVIVIIIVVLFLVFLFIFLKRRKNEPTETQNS